MYKSYMKMVAEAQYFMKIHNVRMSGEDIKPGTKAIVIPRELLEELGEKIKEFEKKSFSMEKPVENNPYNVPEKSSLSEDAAFYFPFGRD